MTNKIVALALTLSFFSCARVGKKNTDCLEGHPTACYSLERKCTDGNQDACAARDALPIMYKRQIVFEFQKRGMIQPAWAKDLPPITDEERRDEELALQRQTLEEQKKANRINAAAAFGSQNVNVKHKADCTTSRVGNQVRTNCN
jgi:hypothetical protein